MEEIAKGLKELLKNEPTVVLGKVNSVNESNNSISATVDGLVYDNIRLNATLISSDGRVLCLPKVNTTVVLAKVEHSEEDFKVLGFDLVTDLIIQFKTTEIKVNENGLMINKGAFSFKTEITNFMDQVINGVVATATGPATFDPATKLQLEQTKANLLQILK